MRNLKKAAMLLGLAGMMSGALFSTGAMAENSEEVELSVLVVFDPETGSHWKLDSFEEAAEKLGYKVNVERVDDETYKTKVRVMLQANELPDLFYTWGGSYSTPFLEAEALYSLEDALAASGYALDEVYKQTDEEGHIYAVPAGALETYCLFYNKAVFEQIGMDVPTNWDELLAVVDACNEQGIGALGIGDIDRWQGDLFYNMMVLREDADAFANAVEEGGTFTGDAFVKAAEKVQTLVEKNAFQSGYMQATASECTELLQAGQIAMHPIGSWMVSSFAEDDNIGCTVFPKTGEEDPYLSCCGNAADAGMAVAASSDHPEEAAKLAVEYSKILSDHLIEDGEQGYFETDIEAADQSEIMKQYLEDFAKLEKTQLWWFTYLDTSIGEPMRDLSQQQFAGEIDSASFVEQLEQIMKG